MNIIFYLRSFQLGGVEKVTTFLANSFSKDGYKVIILVHFPISSFLLEQLDKTIIVQRYNNYFDSMKLIRKYSRKQKAVIINQWGLQSYYAFGIRIASFRTKTKLISVYHNKPSFNGMISKANQRYLNKQNVCNNIIRKIICKIVSVNMHISYSFSDNYILLSKNYIDDFKNFTHTKDLTKLRIIPNPITCYTGVNNKKENTILYVGRVDDKQKKVNRIIEIWEKIYPKYKDWNLYIVGEGDSKVNLKQYVIKNNIQRVNFIDFSSPELYYSKSKIFLLTSDFEGFPLVLCEAMTYGVVPIVYNTFEAATDIIDNNKSGVLINNYNDWNKSENEFINKITLLMNDDFLLAKMSENAMIKASDYSIEKIMMHWKNLI